MDAKSNVEAGLKYVGAKYGDTDRPPMHDFEVALVAATERIQVRAAYYQSDSRDNLIIFKDDSAKIVFAIPPGNVLYVRKLSPSSVAEAEQKLRDVQQRIVARQAEDTQDLIDAQRELVEARRAAA